MDDLILAKTKHILIYNRLLKIIDCLNIYTNFKIKHLKSYNKQKNMFDFHIT